MTKKHKDGSVGPWAKEKLAALNDYLGFYTTALKNQNHWLRGTTFVDAFAGPGLSRVRSGKKVEVASGFVEFLPEVDTEQVELVKGSPRIALDIANPFSAYLFVDLDPKRIAELNELKKEYGSTRHMTIHEGDANAAIRSWLASGIDWKHHRAVVFLDPFGMQVSWATIAALAETKGVEVIVNFPLHMAIQRLLTKSGDIPQNWQDSLDALFGSREWRDLVYEKGNNLFGPTISRAEDSALRILEWYRGRLKTLFGNVSTARLIKNTRGNPLYYVIWAGPNGLGLKGAEYVLSKGERVKDGRR
jgi:three-Cys-motif partner protein